MSLGLTSEVWIVQIGIFLNMLGYGAVLPFEVIYLHEARGFGLGTSGLIIGAISGFALLGAPIAGPLIDRHGARNLAAAGGFSMAVGYLGLAFVHAPWQGLLAATVAGIGNGALIPSQSALIAALAPADRRHRATALSRVAANVGFGVGGALGGVIASYGLPGFIALYIANAFTYLVYVAVLYLAVPHEPRDVPTPGGYGLLFRDLTLRRLAAINIIIIAIGWGVLPWVVPPYATEQLRLSTGLIGVIMLCNAITVVVAQIPVAKLAEGRKRAATIAAAGAVFALACLLFLVPTFFAKSFAFPILLLGAMLVGIGECLHSVALMPLVADLAPPGARGRYMAAIGLSWWMGLALAPMAGTSLLRISPSAALVPAVALAVVPILAARGLDRMIPRAISRTPMPEKTAPSASPLS